MNVEGELTLHLRDTSLGGDQPIKVSYGGNGSMIIQGKNGYISLLPGDWQRLMVLADLFRIY